MANHDQNNSSSSNKEGNDKNQSSPSNQQGNSTAGGYPEGPSSEERNQGNTDDQKGGEKNSQDLRPYTKEEGAPQQYGDLSREARPFVPKPFSDSGNEWQRVGDSSDSNWWESGTSQQQQVYRGDTGYPYRQNFDQRNQQGQEGMENLYPQEPASEQQKRNFAEGTQYPYEGGFGAGNVQAREGLERARGLEPFQQNQANRQGQSGASAQQSYGGGQYPYGGNFGERAQEGLEQDQQKGPHHLNYQKSAQAYFRNESQTTNQNINTMRTDDRNFRRNNNEYQDRDYGRDRNGRFSGDYGFRPGRREEDFDRFQGRRGYYGDRDYNLDYDQGRQYNRGNEQGRGYNRDRYQDRERYTNLDRDRYSAQDYNDRRSGQAERGDYYSTRTDYPGRGYDTEREMNRHSYYGGSGRDRSFRGERNYRPESVHRSTGSYEDFERDLDRFGIRRDRDRYGSYDRQNREQSRDRFDDPRLDRGPSGSWGRNVQDSDRYDERRGRY